MTSHIDRRAALGSLLSASALLGRQIRAKASDRPLFQGANLPPCGGPAIPSNLEAARENIITAAQLAKLEFEPWQHEMVNGRRSATTSGSA